MKATVNYDLKGDEEPGVQGRAQNLYFTPCWAWAQILGLQLPCFKHSYLRRFRNIGTPEEPQEVDIGHLWSHHVSYTSIWNLNWAQSGTILAISEA